MIALDALVGAGVVSMVASTEVSVLLCIMHRLSAELDTTGGLAPSSAWAAV